MHNKCLTVWLLIEDTCPVCRYKIGAEFSDNLSQLDDEYDDSINVAIKFNNDLITSHHIKVRNAILEISAFLSDREEIVYTNNVWTTNGNDSYYLKLKTKQQIIDIEVDCHYIDEKTKKLYITFNSIDKKINYHKNMLNNNSIFISNYNERMLPMRSLWLH
jgi:hypothetical protein